MNRTKTVRQEYMLLSCQMLPDKEFLEDQIKTLATPADAARLASSHWQVWQYTPVNGSFGILKYRGVDVAVFYKRQVVKVRPSDDGVVDGFQARVIGSESEAWMRISLLDSKSSMKQTQFYSAEFDKMKVELGNARGLINSLRLENDQTCERIRQLENQLTEALEKKKKGT